MFANTITTFEVEHRRLLRNAAADFVAGSATLADLRKLQATNSFSHERFSQMAGLGWLGMAFNPETGLGIADMAALHRELGRGLLPEPVIASGVLAAGIAANGDGPFAAEALDRIVSGRSIVTLAWQGAAGAMGAADAAAVAVRAAAPESANAGEAGWRIDGQLRFVAWADHADALLVAARAADGLIIGWIDLNVDGLTITPASALDRSSFCDLRLDAVWLPASQVVVLPGKAADLLDRMLDVGRIAISAELVGLAERLFQITLDYLKHRQQFGKPIGSNQSLQFTSVDLYVQIELANSTLMAAAATLDANDDRAACARAASRCKSRCADAALLMAKQAIQLHGAIGYTDECDVSLFVKRAYLWAAWLGNGAAHRKRLRRDLVSTAEPPAVR